MDFQGNKVHATLYDGNINAFEDQLILSKTYIVSNALVKDTKPEYKAANELGNYMDCNNDISILAVAIDMRPKQKECITLAEKIANKPVILANRLKVSSFNGLTLSTKINSTFFIDGGFNQVAEFRAWVEAHAEELNEITLEKPSLALTPTKLSPPMHKKFTQIHNIKGRLLGRKYFWIKAKSTILAKKQAF
ncbi:unnamed protein product [Fraxinus pennsylvanica]|uniref:Uncharacterized protein n=1 Tax=Fraxinus pennsylvanica TaxID=56036 RepID=A0AAD1Z0P3_9LAMI|nr:unnamed protein product [Fraxinus pennsylvanica]